MRPKFAPSAPTGCAVPRVLLLTDRSQLRLGRGLVRTVAECAEAGLGHVVVRELDESPECRHALIEEIATIDGLTVLSAHHPDPAAAGVHLAADQPPPPAGAWFGRSCHTAGEVRAAAAEEAAYAVLSPFAATASKPGHGPPVPPQAYAGHPLPVLALGGITPANAADAVAAGAHGVAVMGAVMRAAAPAGIVADLLRVVEEAG